MRISSLNEPLGEKHRHMGTRVPQLRAAAPGARVIVVAMPCCLDQVRHDVSHKDLVS